MSILKPFISKTNDFSFQDFMYFEDPPNNEDNGDNA